ncbi:hypothetical protein J437_LFUL008953 [Ladona fulva]|uniref:Zinc transporter 1 n=1 Tax=Ladona fulva TaxID=123851 RepID=A0A8K0KGD3_LADFU|nr:hypothetical protein J437_LFUL008953 [Ladona fulva]
MERAVTQDSVRHNKKMVNSMGSKNGENDCPVESMPCSEVVNGISSQSAIVAAPAMTQPSPAAVATSYLQAGISGTPPLRQGPKEMFRDVIGCVLVIVCSITVYFTDAQVAKYADPIISIFSAVILLVLSYPYMKESGLILLQTIPDHINIESLRSRLCEAFSAAVVGVHDLHIWQLTPQRTYATVHVVFANSKNVSSVMKQVTEFFHEQGINHVTIQPEFHRCQAISYPNGAYSEIPLTSGVFEPSIKTERCKSYTITMDNGVGKNGDGPVCFLQCTGKGGSCHKLHCCDDGKGFPLPLPHHHHHETHPRYRRRHSLDEVIEHKENDIPGNLVSSSSPNIIIKQQKVPKEELPCTRRAVSDDALEKSATFSGQDPKTEVIARDNMSSMEDKDLPQETDSYDSETELKMKELKDQINEESILVAKNEVSRTDSTEDSHLQSVIDS